MQITNIEHPGVFEHALLELVQLQNACQWQTLQEKIRTFQAAGGDVAVAQAYFESKLLSRHFIAWRGEGRFCG